MLTLFLTILLHLSQANADQPLISLDWPELTSAHADEVISLSVSVQLMEGQQPQDFKLLPLALENMVQESLSVTVTPAATATMLHYQMTLRAGSAGNAALGELQFEHWGLSDGGERIVTAIYTHPGFSLQIVNPPNWGLMLGAIAVFIVVGMAIAGIVRYTNKRNRAQSRMSPQQRIRNELLAKIEDQRIAAEFGPAIITADTLLQRELHYQSRQRNENDSAIRQKLRKTIADFIGAERLAEEVRYGGHAATAKEVNYFVSVLRQVFAETDSQKEYEE